MNLVLFSSTYPFDGGAEQTFLDPELAHLSRVFERVILVPKKIVGNCLPLPANVTVDETYARLLSKVNALALTGEVFGARLFYQELLSRAALAFYPSALIRMSRFLAVARLTCRWVLNWLDQSESGPNVFYTYWFDSSSLGIGLAKQRHPRIKLVSRAHGYDLYEEPYYRPPYWPFRRRALALLDALFPDSGAGTRYLAQKYPDSSSIYETALLGVTDPGFASSASSDGCFRIVSCSMLVPMKRVDLLLDGMHSAARRRPDQQFLWTHKGNGSARDELQKKADRLLPKNARAFFPGYSDKAALMQFYRQDPADVFVNVSASEGTPVSIMEAASCGIPIIATAVGGNPEIVSERNGVLLGANPAPEEIAEAFFTFLDNPEVMLEKRKGSRAVWMERYNADINFRSFAERLRSIGES